MSEEIAGELVPVVETNELVNKFAFFDGRVTRYVIYGVAITGASLATILLIKRLVVCNWQHFLICFATRGSVYIIQKFE